MFLNSQNWGMLLTRMSNEDSSYDQGVLKDRGYLEDVLFALVFNWDTCEYGFCKIYQ